MTKYRAKEIAEIEAEQFLPPHQIPKGVTKNFDDYTVITFQGEMVSVRSGEWIVKEEYGFDGYYPIADDVFQRKYEKV